MPIKYLNWQYMALETQQHSTGNIWYLEYRGNICMYGTGNLGTGNIGLWEYRNCEYRALEIQEELDTVNIQGNQEYGIWEYESL